MSKDAVNV